MYKSLRIEIKPNKEQTDKINQTINAMNCIYNLFITENEKLLDKHKYMTAYDFSKYFNNVYIKENESYKWIKQVSSKSVKQAMIYADSAFKKFFKKELKYPRLKNKDNSLKAYFIKDSKTSFIFYRHKIKIPTLGFVRLKEYGYIPKNCIIKSGTIERIGNRYFLSLKTVIEDNQIANNNIKGLGIDLGIKETAICSDNTIYKNINKTQRVKKLKKKIKRIQRGLARQVIQAKKDKVKLKFRRNYQKRKRQFVLLNYKLNNIRNDFINKMIAEIIKKPIKYITIEDLKVRNLMKNRHLSKAIAEQKWREIREKLIYKCKWRNVELRVVSSFYPSSQTCSKCGNKKRLKLSDRTYKCDICNLIIDRDLNASINLMNCSEYKIS